MEIRVLGCIEVARADSAVPLRGRRDRALLAASTASRVMLTLVGPAPSSTTRSMSAIVARMGRDGTIQRLPAMARAAGFDHLSAIAEG
jgi:hypothetical protein